MNKQLDISGYPRPGLADFLTRQDELMIRLIETLTSLDRAINIVVPLSKQEDKTQLRQRAENGEWMPYVTKTFALDVARTDFEVAVEGDFVQAWTDGSLQGTGLRFNRNNNDILYLDRRNPISGFPFWKFYLTHDAQAGQTLDLMIGREASAQALTAEVSVTSSQKFNALRSDKDTHFTGAIAQNAKEDENLTGLLSNKVRIVGLALQADENLSFRVIFWKTDGFDNTDLDLDTYCGEVVVNLPLNGFRVGGANQYYLDVRDIGIDYIDEDSTNELHVSLQCLTAAGKTAGAAGEVALEVYYEPRT